MTNEDQAMTLIHLVIQFPQKRKYLIEVKRGEYIARSGEERFGPSLYLVGFRMPLLRPRPADVEIRAHSIVQDWRRSW